MNHNYDVIVVGAGIFGVTAALELNGRNYSVVVVDPGPLPHPLASSTDISKVIRMEYGKDEEYMAMVEASLPGWHRWNTELGEDLYHQVGVLMLTQDAMRPGSFEHDSFQMLRRRGHDPERIDADEIVRRYPAWKPGVYVDGFFHQIGGYAQSGRVVEALIHLATRQSVSFHPGHTISEISMNGIQVTGVQSREGGIFRADNVIIAAGAWTFLLLPELEPYMRAVGQPVFHLAPGDRRRFTPPEFPVFTADIARTGWYGFPVHPTERVVKIANHGVGQQLHPERDKRLVTKEDEHNLRDFLRNSMPDLADAPLVYTRRCLYCDTLDQHLWIDRHPEYTGLTVAAGGSGHGFKFAPILGNLIADVMEGKDHRWQAKFQWRDLAPRAHGEEEARYHG